MYNYVSTNKSGLVELHSVNGKLAVKDVASDGTIQKGQVFIKNAEITIISEFRKRPQRRHNRFE